MRADLTALLQKHDLKFTFEPGYQQWYLYAARMGDIWETDYFFAHDLAMAEHDALDYLENRDALDD